MLAEVRHQRPQPEQIGALEPERLRLFVPALLGPPQQAGHERVEGGEPDDGDDETAGGSQGWDRRIFTASERQIVWPSLCRSIA